MAEEGLGLEAGGNGESDANIDNSSRKVGCDGKKEIRGPDKVLILLRFVF